MNRRFFIWVILLCIVLILASVTAAQDDETESIAGIWQTDGYSWVFDIRPDHFIAYQATSATCVLFAESSNVDYQSNSAHVFDLTFPGYTALLFGTDPFDLELVLEDDRDTFLFDDGGAAPIYAHRVESLPVACADGVEDAEDAETLFEVFWHMFNENYAFFDLHGVDWQQAYDTYRPQISAETSLEDLHTIMVNMLTPFTDAHVNLLSSYGFFSAAPIPTWTNDDDDTIAAYAMLAIEDYVIEPQIVANDQIVYGQLAENIGYINVLSMDSFSTDDDDIAVLQTVMTHIMATFADVDSIVLDVRFNGGGEDLNSLFIAGFFTDAPYLAFSKQTWTGDAYTDLFDVFVEPVVEEPFLGPVYLLTSGVTTSGAEIFTLAMDARPDVTIVGETTAGALSDILMLLFPNGWFATLSNEQYLSHEGVLYERIGIPVDVDAPMSLEAFENGVDPVLDALLELAQGA